MTPWSALAVCAVGIACLFYADRDASAQTSKALWLPVIWLWIVASRPVSSWLGISSGPPERQLLDGSPLDRFIFLVLLIAGISVLLYRSRERKVFLAASWPVLIYFSYCLLSVLWSDFPDIAFRRWSKALGDLVMVLIVVTDSDPRAALKRVFSRVGFILLPASVLVIRYFGDLGRSYDPFNGQPMNIGVAVDKNLLGVTTIVLALGAVWRVVTLLRDSEQPNLRRHLLAQGTLLAFGIALFILANSATSLVCFTLGSGLIVVTGLLFRRSRPVFVHVLVLTALAAGMLLVSLGGDADVIHALGRQTDLTGRVAIWHAVIPMAPDPLFGAGFESFWLGSRIEALWRAFPVFHPNEAHNGYIEVYLNLGWVGIALIAIILVNGYRRATSVFRYDSILGALLVSYILIAAVYSITEAGFRMLDGIWIFLLLAVAASGQFASSPAEEQEPEDEEASLPADGSYDLNILREGS